MDANIIAALLSACSGVLVGLITFAGVRTSNSKTQAVLEEKVVELTREVREHNEFAKRVPVLEEKVSQIEDDIKEIKSKI